MHTLHCLNTVHGMHTKHSMHCMHTVLAAHSPHWLLTANYRCTIQCMRTKHYAYAVYLIRTLH